jgi:hypothetical protein
MNVKYCSIMSYCIYKIVCDDLPEYIYVGSTKAFRKENHNIKANVIMVILKNYILQLERMEVGTTGVWL